MKRVGIIGATGYTGQVLVSILLTHPKVEISLVTSNSYQGMRYSDVFPSFKGTFDLELKSTEGDYRDLCDVFFICLPHGKAMEKIRSIYNGDSLIIDLSADFRFEDKKIYERYYSSHICPELISLSVYGLPEVYRTKIKESKLIANPGCYVTCALLSLYPLLKRKLIRERVFIDAKSGVSGAGRELKLGSLFPEVSEGFRAYGIGTHRHEPEIQKEVKKFDDISVTFVPHLVPMNRGILTTIYGITKYPLKTRELLEIFKEEYEGEPFVRVFEEGSFPDTRFVRFSNFFDIGGVSFDDGRFILVSAIDNLVKGASGQAVQNMNIALSFDEKEGLSRIPLFP